MFRKCLLCLMILLYPQFVMASGQYPSPLPTPSAEILNVDIERCSTSCLRDFLERGRFGDKLF